MLLAVSDQRADAGECVGGGNARAAGAIRSAKEPWGEFNFEFTLEALPLESA